LYRFSFSCLFLLFSLFFFFFMLYRILDNGLRVVVIPRPNAPVVSVAVTYAVGSYAESPMNTGFAHLFEHLMFEGSENVAHGLFDKYCSEAGGENNAYTTFDKTSYYMSLPAHQLELGLWLEADRMAAFDIDEEALEIQKNVVLEEINQNVENSPYGSYSRVLNRLAFAPKAGYSWEVYGDPKHIAASTLEDVRNFYRAFYRPDNACLVVCGAIEENGAFALAERYFGEIPRGETPLPAPKEFLPAYRLGARRARVEDTVPTDAVFCSFHFEGYMTREVYCADVLCSILSDGVSSRLYKNLAYERQIASDVNAFVDERRFTSLFTLYAISSDKAFSADALHEGVWEVLRKLLAEGVEEREMQKAKNRIRTRISRTMQRASGIADEAAHQALFFDDPSRVFRIADDYASVTTEEVVALARRIFSPENEARVDFVPRA
jgi:predicted Zn-dependent peptidase